MAVTRRQFLMGGVSAGALLAAGASGCAPQPRGDGTTQLTLAWWGNDVRNKNTDAAIAAFGASHPTVTLLPQPTEGAAYFDKLATQVAGDTSPDIIQMDLGFLSEYADRGALLDLGRHGADTSKFISGTADAGTIDDTLYGVNAGTNTIAVLANPAIFERAGMDVPDDTSWTWDELIETSAEVAAKAKLAFGIAGLMNGESMFQAWLRQQGKDLWTTTGLAFEADDVTRWFDLMTTAQKAGAVGSPQHVSEEFTQSLDQSGLAVGTAALQVFWSNQLQALEAASGAELQVLRFPSLAGTATQRKAWYKASMLWTVSSRTKDPEAAVAFVNWWVNTTEAAEIDLGERGIPANAEVQASILPKLSSAQQQVSRFLTAIEPELAATPLAPPPGGSPLYKTMFRYGTEVMFARMSSAEAAQKLVDEVTADLQV